VDRLANNLLIGTSQSMSLINLYTVYLSNLLEKFLNLLKRSTLFTVLERLRLISFCTIVADKITKRITWYVNKTLANYIKCTTAEMKTE